MRLTIVTPAPADSRNGNRTTAERWAAQLRALGHTVSIVTQWRPPEDAAAATDALVALHARRSRCSVEAWKKTHPSQPLVLVLTGTDLYRDIRTDAEARRSLDQADRLVVLQEKGLDELAPSHRNKARVIYQSVAPRRRRQPPRRCFLVTVIGHLREEKDPFCAARALVHLPQGAAQFARLRVVQLGQALSEAAAIEAQRHMETEPRYRWRGELPHAMAMGWLARSHAMVISSRMEGGAHVVSEAIAAGVPVLASDIPGNVGLLGEDYPAYYPVGNDAQLARLLQRAQGEPAWLASLAAKLDVRRSLVSEDREREALRGLIDELEGWDVPRR